MNGTSVPETIKQLSKQKIVTAFVDGDRGGDLIIKELLGVADIDYVAKAPDGKEVEEITKKELHKALRSRITVDQYKLEKGFPKGDQEFATEEQKQHRISRKEARVGMAKEEPNALPKEELQLTDEDRERFKEMSEELLGSRGAYLLDEKLKVMGKVPLSELEGSLKDLVPKVFAIVMDSVIDKDIVNMAKRSNVKCLVGKEIKVDPTKTRLALFVADEL